MGQKDVDKGQNRLKWRNADQKEVKIDQKRPKT